MWIFIYSSVPRTHEHALFTKPKPLYKEPFENRNSYYLGFLDYFKKNTSCCQISLLRYLESVIDLLAGFVIDFEVLSILPGKCNLAEEQNCADDWKAKHALQC